MLAKSSEKSNASFFPFFSGKRRKASIILKIILL